MTLEERAKQFATERHAAINHIRKYTGEPYINHPAAVVELVRSVPHTEEMLAAAWLHDTVEDTETTFDEIGEIFGLDVAWLVLNLTDVSVPSDGNRKARKTLDRLHTATAKPEAKTIKLADLIDNSSSILEFDYDFARVYIEEKRLLLEVLKDGDPVLWDRANKIVQDALIELNK